MHRRLTILLLTFFLMTACGEKATPAPSATPTLADGNSKPSTPTPTELPSISPTPKASLTPVPTLVFPTFLPPSQEPTATPQLSPVLASGAIQVLAPGPMSKVLSPIHLRGYAIPGYLNHIQVSLYGEDGTLIFREVKTVYTDLFKWAYFSIDIPFQIRAASELARLQVSTEDKAGNVLALMAVHLLLFPEGYEVINPPGDLGERCILFTPLYNAEAYGGTISVAGSYHPFNTQPIILELVTEDGVYVSTSQWLAVPSTSDGLIPFSAEVSYSVEASTPAYLIIRQFDDRINGNMYLFSRRVILNP